MKRNLLLLPFLLAVIWGSASAQNQTRSRRVTNPDAIPSGTGSNTEPSITASLEKQANHSAKRNTPNTVSEEPPSTTTANASENGSPVWGNSPIVRGQRTTEQTITSKAVDTSSANAMTSRKLVEPTVMALGTSAARATLPPSTGFNAAGTTAIPVVRRSILPTQEYRVGIGDVLDIRVMNNPTRESTLFTVLNNGSIEYPLLNAPISVTGLTTDEIAIRLVGEIKVIEDARVSVDVRDYASHAVVITGWVDSPGRKMLRREAMPLYAVLAEALPRAEASFATIIRDQKAGPSLALNDQKAMSTLLSPGDVIKISGREAAPKQFLYVGGQVVSPGEKDFRSGMTLTQAILASGGTARDATKSVKISRRNADGFLVASEYDMRAIREGRSPDPLVQAGDRIEVGLTLW